MLDAARRDHPGIDFAAGDIATWQPSAPCDVVFSNASLQWVGDHERLIPRLFDAGRAGRRPRGADAAQPRFRDARADAPGRRRGRVARPPRRRARPVAGQAARVLLRPAGAALRRASRSGRPTTSRSWTSVAAIIAWLHGTGLRPFLARLTDGERPVFLDRYAALLAEAYPGASRRQDPAPLPAAVLHRIPAADNANFRAIR